MRILFSVSLVFVLACAPDARPAALEPTGATTIGFVPQSTLVAGHDGGQSALVFGRAVWLYGDTALAVTDTAGSNFHGNSFAWTDKPSVAGLSQFHERVDAAGAPILLLPNTDDELAFTAAHAGDTCAEQPCGARWAVWPTAIAWDAPRGRALVFYALVQTQPGPLNYVGGGRSLATWSTFAAQAERPVVAGGVPEHPTLLFGPDDPPFGDGVAIDGDWLYTWACPSRGLEQPCAMARAPVDRALERAAYQGWDGEAWTSDLKRAVTLFDGGLGITVFPFLGQWVVSYTGPIGDDVLARTAPSPTGPWSDEVLLLRADRKGHDGWTYDAYAHPELSAPGMRELYVSYTRPNGVGWFGSETVLVRVTFR